MAAFPVEELPKMEGKPNLNSIMTAIKELVKCARTFEDTELGPMGMIFLCMTPEQYVIYTQEITATPVCPPGIDDIKQETICIAWPTNKKEYDNVRHMNHALIKLFLASMEKAYRDDAESDFVGVPNLTFLQVAQWFQATYGRPGPMDWDANCESQH